MSLRYYAPVNTGKVIPSYSPRSFPSNDCLLCRPSHVKTKRSFSNRVVVATRVKAENDWGDYREEKGKVPQRKGRKGGNGQVFLNVLDFFSVAGTIGGATAVLLGGDIILITLPIALPVMSLIIGQSRERKRTNQSEAVELEVARELEKSQSALQNTQENVSSLRRELDQKLENRMKFLERKIGAMEGTVISTGDSVQQMMSGLRSLPSILRRITNLQQQAVVYSVSSELKAVVQNWGATQLQGMESISTRLKYLEDAVQRMEIAKTEVPLTVDSTEGRFVYGAQSRPIDAEFTPKTGQLNEIKETVAREVALIVEDLRANQASMLQYLENADLGKPNFDSSELSIFQNALQRLTAQLGTFSGSMSNEVKQEFQLQVDDFKADVSLKLDSVARSLSALERSVVELKSSPPVYSEGVSYLDKTTGNEQEEYDAKYEELNKSMNSIVDQLGGIQGALTELKTSVRGQNVLQEADQKEQDFENTTFALEAEKIPETVSPQSQDEEKDEVDPEDKTYLEFPATDPTTLAVQDTQGIKTETQMDRSANLSSGRMDLGNEAPAPSAPPYETSGDEPWGQGQYTFGYPGVVPEQDFTAEQWASEQYRDLPVQGFQTSDVGTSGTVPWDVQGEASYFTGQGDEYWDGSFGSQQEAVASTSDQNDFAGQSYGVDEGWLEKERFPYEERGTEETVAPQTSQGMADSDARPNGTDVTSSENKKDLMVEGLRLLKEGRDAVNKEYGTAYRLLCEAMACFEGKLEKEPDNVRALGNCGNTLLTLGELKYQMSQTLDMGDKPSDQKKTQAVKQLVEEAQQLLTLSGQKFKKLLELRSEDDRAYMNWAKALCLRAKLMEDPLLKDKLYDAAIVKYQQVLDSSPDFGPALMACAESLGEWAASKSNQDADRTQLLRQALGYLAEVERSPASDSVLQDASTLRQDFEDMLRVSSSSWY